MRRRGRWNAGVMLAQCCASDDSAGTALCQHYPASRCNQCQARHCKIKGVSLLNCGPYMYVYVNLLFLINLYGKCILISIHLPM